MSLAAALGAEFDDEMAQLRRTLERAPTAQWDWQPHARSMSLGALALHLANIPGWLGGMLVADSYEMSREKRTPAAAEVPATCEETLARFDANCARARAALAACDELALVAPWSLTRAGRPVRTLTRAAAIQSYVIAHAVHHRGQLTVYLRLLDVPVPALYGASADEDEASPTRPSP